MRNLIEVPRHGITVMVVTPPKPDKAQECPETRQSLVRIGSAEEPSPPAPAGGGSGGRAMHATEGNAWDAGNAAPTAW